MKICLQFGKAGVLEIMIDSLALRTYGDVVATWNIMKIPLEIAMREATSHMERLLREGKA